MTIFKEILKTLQQPSWSPNQTLDHHFLHYGGATAAFHIASDEWHLERFWVALFISLAAIIAETIQYFTEKKNKMGDHSEEDKRKNLIAWRRDCIYDAQQYQIVWVWAMPEAVTKLVMFGIWLLIYIDLLLRWVKVKT